VPEKLFTCLEENWKMHILEPLNEYWTWAVVWSQLEMRRGSTKCIWDSARDIPFESRTVIKHHVYISFLNWFIFIFQTFLQYNEYIGFFFKHADSRASCEPQFFLWECHTFSVCVVPTLLNILYYPKLVQIWPFIKKM